MYTLFSFEIIITTIFLLQLLFFQILTELPYDSEQNIPAVKTPRPHTYSSKFREIRIAHYETKSGR